MFKTDTFKLILLRNRNVDKYAKYYLLLEKSVKQYNEYQFSKLQNKVNEINKIK